MIRKPDHEIRLTEEQLSVAAGNYCCDVMRALPANTYPQAQLSITTNPQTGVTHAVFSAWAPPKPVGHMQSGGVPLYVGDDYPRIASRYERTEETDEP